MHKFIVTSSKGLDELVKQEIRDIYCEHYNNEQSVPDVKIQPGQLSFEASLEFAYLLCLNSRLANRVLLVLSEGRVHAAKDLYDCAYKVDWPQQFSEQCSFKVNFSGTNKIINNSQYGALSVKDAIVDCFVDDGLQRPSIDKVSPDIVINARLRRENLSICLDLSGQSLHQRGYRENTGLAPIKEHLAAAMLYKSDWLKSGHCLFDPMCGSGTIAIEAALMAANMPPNLERRFWGFDHYNGHQHDVFTKLKETLKASVTKPKQTIFAYDISTKVLEHAIENAKNANVEQYIQFKQCDAITAKINDEKGYIICNPPYGERLDDYVSLLPLFTRWGHHLKSEFKNWNVGVLCSDDRLLKALKLRSKQKSKLFNGRLESTFATYILDSENTQIFDRKPQDSEFSNRLRKNLKRLKPWVNKLSSDAYRIYDADLPNYNFAIDRYADWVILQEYAAPKSIPESVTQERLAIAFESLPSILDVPRSKLVLKTRQKQSGEKQYKKLDDRGSRVVVFENDAKFYVNPHDYLDVGLFLDHRITRRIFADLCANKDVLNLFCYTASVSVHAAMAGARSVVSVDMSKTYLNWAKDNFKLNKLSGHYEFIQANCIKWLNDLDKKTKFDCIFIDPPSFSNSKRMEQTWDVQRDHVSLLINAKQHLAKNGIILFSNNLRSFKLDHQALEQANFTVKDITQTTIDQDFKRRPNIHRCWILSL